MNNPKLNNESVQDNILDNFLHKEAAHAQYVGVLYDSSYYILEKGTENYEIFTDKDYYQILSFSNDLEKLKQELINSLDFKIGSNLFHSNTIIEYKPGVGVNGATRKDEFKVFSISFDKENVLHLELAKDFNDFFLGDSQIVYDLASLVTNFDRHLIQVKEISNGGICYDQAGDFFYYSAGNGIKLGA